MNSRPLPVPDAATQPFWDGAAGQELRLPRCPSCSKFFYPPPPRCPRCLKDDLEWAPLSGRVLLRGWTTITITGAVPGRVAPVTLAECSPVESPETVIVVLDEAGVTDGAEPDMPVRVVFRVDANGWTYPELAAAEVAR